MGHTDSQLAALRKNNIESNAITRESIHEALFQLMETRNYEDIRITDIINKAGVSRSAFYRNFKSMDDILKDYMGDFNELVFHAFSRDVRENWHNYLIAVKKNRSKLEMLIKAGREYLLLDKLNELVDYSSGRDFARAIPHGYIYNVTIYWVKCGLPGEIEEVTDLIMQACRENAVIMYNGIIPSGNYEVTMQHNWKKK
jgi:AcrR family transcriptional regulator